MFAEIILRDLTAPLAKRLESHRGPCGPYRWKPTKAGSGRGFYSSSRDRLAMGDAPLRLRLEDANDHLRGSRTADTLGYYCDGDGDTLQPIIARLPRGRGFLAGWTMGAGMCGSLEPDIFADETDAALAAHSIAENDAERNREYEAAHHCDECGDWCEDADDLEDGKCAACRGELDSVDGAGI